MHRAVLLLFFGLSCIDGLATDDQKKNLLQELHQHTSNIQDRELLDFDAQREIAFFLLLHTERMGPIPKSLLTHSQIQAMEKYTRKLEQDLSVGVNQARSLQTKLNVLSRSRFKAKNVMSCVVLDDDRDREAEDQLMRVRSGAATLECDRCKKQ